MISGFRCGGRNYDKMKCCSPKTPCRDGEGTCDVDADCKDGLTCGESNCKNYGDFYHENDNCCTKNNASKETWIF